MAKKTDPVSIRFNPQHLTHALGKFSVDKPQALVDTMLEQLYAIDHPVPNVFAVPSAAQQNHPSPVVKEVPYSQLLRQAKAGPPDQGEFAKQISSATHLTPNQKATILASLKK